MHLLYEYTTLLTRVLPEQHERRERAESGRPRRDRDRLGRLPAPASPSAAGGCGYTFRDKGLVLDGSTGSWPYVELVGPPGAAEDLNIGGYICRDHGALASIAGIRPPQTPQQSSCNVHDGVKLHRIGAPAAHRYRPDSLAVADAKYRTARVMIYTKHELRTMDRGCAVSAASRRMTNRNRHCNP